MIPEMIDVIHFPHSATPNEVEVLRKRWRDITGRDCVILSGGTTWAGSVERGFQPLVNVPLEGVRDESR